jgi:cell wall-associated NlpC family hydrolase
MVKNLIGALIVVGTLASCGAVKSVQEKSFRGAQDTKFLDDISYSPNKTTTYQTFSGNNQLGGKGASEVEPAGVVSEAEADMSETSSLSNKAIQTKYASYLQVSPSDIKNIALYRAISNWLGTRYRYGGTSHKGVDCSSLMQHLLDESDGTSVPRTARLQYGATTRVSRNELKEGDLVFFNTTGGVSHVGMYLQNDKFVHASSSRGVTISDLNENYYTKRYIGGGRIK